MNRYHLLAAEIFSYSFANYRDHLGIGHARFEKLMPNAARTLEQAVNENWPDDRIAKRLEIDVAQVPDYLRRYQRAIEVVDAPNAAQSFRAGVRQSIENVIADGLADEAAVERLVTQVCYRLADLSVLLKREGKPLSHYSEELRIAPEDDADDE